MQAQLAQITDEDREGVVLHLTRAYPRAKVGDYATVRQAYGGRWRLSELGWEPECEWLLRMRFVKEMSARVASLDEEKALAAGLREAKIYDATPTWDDLKREIPGFEVIQHPDGTKSAKFRDTSLDGRYKKRIEEMYGEARRLELEKSEERSAQLDWTDIGTAYHPDLVPVQHADKKARKKRGG